MTVRHYHRILEHDLDRHPGWRVVGGHISPSVGPVLLIEKKEGPMWQNYRSDRGVVRHFFRGKSPVSLCRHVFRDRATVATEQRRCQTCARKLRDLTTALLRG